MSSSRIHNLGMSRSRHSDAALHTAAQPAAAGGRTYPWTGAGGVAAPAKLIMTGAVQLNRLKQL